VVDHRRQRPLALAGGGMHTAEHLASLEALPARYTGARCRPRPHAAHTRLEAHPLRIAGPPRDRCRGMRVRDGGYRLAESSVVAVAWSSPVALTCRRRGRGGRR
jgi:hypothetical protein